MSERLIGQHTMRFEPPWLVHLVARGDVTPEDAIGFGAFVREHVGDAPFLMSLNDLRELGEIGAEARKAAGHAVAGLPFCAIALIGGGFRQRLVAKMAFTALQVFSPSFRGVKLGLFDTDAAARDWLAERAREGAAARKSRR